MARKTLYEKLDIESKLGLVEGWKRDGLTDEQIAKNLGVSKDTLIKWKNEKKEFFESIKRGKEVSDYELENTLHKRATGYYYEEETVTNAGKVVKVKKYEHANPTSLIFALKIDCLISIEIKLSKRLLKNIEINIGDYNDEP